jgi:acetyl-CoA carboxylase biotin carboxyl carrier protein
MNLRRLKDLVSFMKATDLHEVVWEQNGSAVTVRRDAGRPQGASKQTAAGAKAGQSVKTSETLKPVETPVIRSTMVGTFFRSDSSDRPPFVVEGTVVAAGQSVGAIEAMKIMKDVVSPMPCKIVKALVANGHAVEYGQPLFEVEPQRENV